MGGSKHCVSRNIAFSLRWVSKTLLRVGISSCPCGATSSPDNIRVRADGEGRVHTLLVITNEDNLLECIVEP